MIRYILIVATVIVVIDAMSIFNSEEYIDPIINDLLNGVSGEEVTNVEDNDLSLTGGIWKCGQCDNLSESKLLYSDVNVAEDTFDSSLSIEIGVNLTGMKCITIRGTKSAIVKRVVGECDSSEVTLTLAPSEHFLLNVYGD